LKPSQRDAPTWDELLQQEHFQGQEPYAGVVAFADRLEADGARRVLDLGCGHGRHVLYLVHRGFAVCGLDASSAGLDSVRVRLDQLNLSAELTQGDMTELPYDDADFDAVVSTFVIYHGTLATLQQAIAEFHRVLRPGGWTLLTGPSRRDFRYGHGEPIEPHTFITSKGHDAGVPHHFCDREELERLLQGFAIETLDLIENPDDAGHLHSHWEVWACKLSQ